MIDTPMAGPSWRTRVVPWTVASAAGVGVMAALAATPVERGAAATPLVADTGYVIESEVVVRSCQACHARDEDGRMDRLSYLRKTPEEWQRSIRRMATLHGVRVEPEAAREIVRYLSNAQGLAPEELEPGAFEVERRMVPYRYPDRSTEVTCGACHSMGRVITSRRTPEEWEFLVDTHRALYPLVDELVFFDTGAPEPPEDDPGAVPMHPVERAVAHLARAYPLQTPEWRAWSANLRAPRLEGTWALSGHEPGRGPVYGTVEIRAVPGRSDEFTTTARYRYAGDGSEALRTGSGLVYTGYQWRGRSQGPGGGEELREVMAVERGWEEITGRWFTGAHDEFGLDVTLRRVAAEPVLSGVHPRALRAGSGVQEVRMHGANLPASLAASSVDLGPGVRVLDVVSASPTLAVLRVEARADARPGARDAFLGGTSLTDALLVYERVDGIRVVPELGLARVGGVVVPKQYQQFEARAYQSGPDGEPQTEDDLEIGVVPVEWSLEEYPVTYDDDDLAYVGAIDARGLFTPAPDGPNPERSRNRNNIGEVWAVATYTSPEGRTFRERAYLIVTVPVHLRWDEQATLEGGTR